MKYAFALAAIAGLAAAQPHAPNHARFHKRDEMKTVTHWDVVTVTDVVTVYGPSPAPEPTQPAAPPAQSPSKAASSPPAQVSSPAAAPPPAQPTTQAPPPVQPTTQAPKPQPTSEAAPAPAQSSPAASPPSGGSGVGKYGLQPGATAPADCTKDAPCKVGMTTYDTGLGACGYDDTAPNNQDVVALQMDMFGSVTNSGLNSPTNKLCNKKIQITNPATGATAVGTIRDRCQGCTGSGGIDLSPPLWAKLNKGPGDRLPVEWYFLD